MDRFSDNASHWDKTPGGTYERTPRPKVPQNTGQRPMYWRGAYDGGCYRPGDVVLDDGWLATPNKPTCDRPAPQPVGSPYWVYQGVEETAQTIATQVVSGNRYTFTRDGYYLGWRAWVVAGNRYRVSVVTDPLGVPKVQSVADFEAPVGGWMEFASDPTIVTDGLTVDVTVVASQPDPSPVQWTANYAYTTPNNPGVPGSGVASQANNEAAIIRFHKTDSDGTDRGAELLALNVGDQIEANGSLWSIQLVEDRGTWVGVTVAPAVQTGDGTHEFTFSTVAESPVTFMVDPDYWVGSANQGFVGETYGSIVLSDTAYGVDLLVQEGEVSEDWDFLASSQDGAASTPQLVEDGVWLVPEPGQTIANGVTYSMLWELDTHEDAPTPRTVEWTNHGVRVAQAGMYYITMGLEIGTNNLGDAWRANGELWKGTDLFTGYRDDAVLYERHRIEYSDATLTPGSSARISQVAWLEAGATFSGVAYISGNSVSKPITPSDHASWLRITRMSP